MNTFGERFKGIRLSKNLTQEQLVDEFNKLYGYGFTKTTISQYENNKRIPEMNAIRSFAEYFQAIRETYDWDFETSIGDGKNNGDAGEGRVRL